MVDTETAVERITEFLREQLSDAGADGYVVGISGGLDSAVAVTLAVEAVGNDRVTGMVLPGAPSNEANMADARTLADSLGVSRRDIDISSVVEAIRRLTPYDAAEEALGNVRARTRMLFLYFEANVENLLVIGPSNKTEILLGYFTKYGDGAADVRPLADLYKTDVKEVARAIDLDPTFIQKTPTAGLWEGQTDEGELGASYETIDAILRPLVKEDSSVETAAERANVSVERAERFKRMIEQSENKRAQPPFPIVPR